MRWELHWVADLKAGEQAAVRTLNLAMTTAVRPQGHLAWAIDLLGPPR